jgi:hypothetical protein
MMCTLVVSVSDCAAHQDTSVGDLLFICQLRGRYEILPIINRNVVKSVTLSKRIIAFNTHTSPKAYNQRHGRRPPGVPWV